MPASTLPGLTNEKIGCGEVSTKSDQQKMKTVGVENHPMDNLVVARNNPEQQERSDVRLGQRCDESKKK